MSLRDQREQNGQRTHQQLWDAWSRLWNGDYAIAEDIIASTMRVNIPEHGMPDPSTLHDGPSVASWIAAFRSSFDADARISGELGPFFVGDYAIGRWVFHGTWQGGRPDTATACPGTEVIFRGVDILRFEDGHVVEYWLSDDQLDLYARLGAVRGGVTAAEGSGEQLRGRLAGLPETSAREVLLALVLDRTAELLESDTVRGSSGNDAFQDLGIDSLTGAALRQSLQEESGSVLPSTLVFDHPTPKALADHLWTQLSDAPDDPYASALDALERLEQAVSTLPDRESGVLDDKPRMQLVERTTSVLGLLSPTSGDEHSAASADELFAYLDSTLGTPNGTASN